MVLLRAGTAECAARGDRVLRGDEPHRKPRDCDGRGARLQRIAVPHLGRRVGGWNLEDGQRPGEGSELEGAASARTCPDIGRNVDPGSDRQEVEYALRGDG